MEKTTFAIVGALLLAGALWPDNASLKVAPEPAAAAESQGGQVIPPPPVVSDPIIIDDSTPSPLQPAIDDALPNPVTESTVEVSLAGQCAGGSCSPSALGSGPVRRVVRSRPLRRPFLRLFRRR